MVLDAILFSQNVEKCRKSFSVSFPKFITKEAHFVNNFKKKNNKMYCPLVFRVFLIFFFFYNYPVTDFKWVLSKQKCYTATNLSILSENKTASKFGFPNINFLKNLVQSILEYKRYGNNFFNNAKKKLHHLDSAKKLWE